MNSSSTERSLMDRSPGISRSFDTTLPYDDVEEWSKQANGIATARARKDFDADRPDIKPGLRHLLAVLRSMYRGHDLVLYSVCPRKLDVLAVLIGRILFLRRIGMVMISGDMWEPGKTLDRIVTRRFIRLCDAAVSYWVVHSDADRQCFVEVWGIDESKVRIARADVTPDWDSFPPLALDRPYIFVGGNSLRDFGPIVAAARQLHEIHFLFATTALDRADLPPNAELLPVDRRTYQSAMIGSLASVVPLRAGIRRSAGQQTYLNAMRAGSVPIVAQGPAVDEHIVDGVDGLIVDGTIGGYVRAISRLIDPANKAGFDRMRAAAVERAKQVPPGSYVRSILKILDEARGEQDNVRVAMLMQNYLPVIGGAQRQLAQLLPRYASAGIDSTVIARPVDGSPTREPVDGGQVRRVGAGGPAFLASLAFTFGAVRQIRRVRPDVIHAFDLLSPTTTALIAKQLFGPSVVVKILRGGEMGDLDRLKAKPFWRLRLRRMRKQIDRVVVISDEIESELLAAGFNQGQLIRINNGVDLDRFAPLDQAEKSELRTELDLPDQPIVMFTGRLNPEKRMSLVLDIWPAVLAELEGATLVVIGDGPEREELEGRCVPGVRFLGASDQVAEYLQASDAFVLPSSTEGLSNSLLEAMAAGLAVVCTPVGGAVDLIEEGENGLLVPVDDGERLRDALVEALGNAETGARLGKGARRTMEKRFSLEATAERHVDLYRQSTS